MISPSQDATAEILPWRTRLLRFLDSGHQFTELERELSYKHRFVNTVFTAAGAIVALFGVWRLLSGENVVVGTLDVLFGIAAGGLILILRRSDKEAVAPIGTLVLALSLLLFSVVYVLIPETVRSGPFLLITASAFFLKGSRNGLRWTLLCVAVLLIVEQLPAPYAKGWYAALTSILDIVCLTLLLALYEMQKDHDAEDLRSNEEMFRTIFNSANDAIFLVDGGRFAQWNSAASALFRCDAECFSGQRLRDLVSADNPPPLIDALERAEQAATVEKSGSIELLLRRPSGADFYASLRLTPVTIAGKVMTQAIIRDIDARKRTEIELAQHREELEQRVRERTRRLEESEIRFARLLELTAEGIFLHENGVIVDATNAFCRLTGYVKQELIGRNFISLLIYPDDTPRVLDYIAAAGTQPYELTIVRNDGTTIEIEAFGRAVDFENRPLRAGVWRDISARKEIERNLRKSQQAAEETTRAKSAFIANMSHEIRTPLSAIIGITHQLQRDASDPAQQDRLERVTGAARHLLMVLTDILDISKIEASKLVLEHRPFSLRKMLNGVTDLIQDAAEQKGLAFRILADDRIPPVLHGDAVRLSQILVNLASNSVKFTEVGNVTLWVSATAVSSTSATLRFRISDSGIGMTPEQQARLFRDFEQAESSTTRKYGGTGLGLSISRRLVELMGSQIHVRSNVGQGSEFWFEVTLPVAIIPPEAVESAAPEITAAMIRETYGGARILLVEDTPINQEVALDLLQEAGLLTDVADNGKQALERLVDDRFDLVLMDLQMPIMDGLTATQEIRARPGNEAIPIIAMTANAYIEDRQRCLQAGMNDYIAKPIEPSLLFAVLARWLPRHAATAGDAAVRASACTTAEPLPLAAGSAEAAIEKLAATAEFAAISGVALAQRKPVRYLELLAQFFSEHGSDGERLRQLLADDTPASRSEALRLAHTLKGLAATFGMSTLLGEAEHLYRRLDAGVLAADVVDSATDLRRAIDALRETAATVTPLME
ncbi:MAG: PAS domain S-box protein [Rhodocyclales bacterium]|nr:PAS domain S-box protein [Rhodocyclales bacterium]